MTRSCDNSVKRPRGHRDLSGAFISHLRPGTDLPGCRHAHSLAQRREPAPPRYPAGTQRSSVHHTPADPTIALVEGRLWGHDETAADWDASGQLRVESSRAIWPRSKRACARAQDSAATVAARMAKSAEEMSHRSEYDYVVVNRDLDASVAEVEAIVTAERLRRTRQIGLADFVNRPRGG